METAADPLDRRFTDDELDAEYDRILSFIEDNVEREVERMGHTIEYDTQSSVSPAASTAPSSRTSLTRCSAPRTSMDS